jgi:hypothetical protein
MPFLTTGYQNIDVYFLIAECVAFCPNFGKSASPLPYNGPIYFSSTTLSIRYMCGNW